MSKESAPLHALAFARRGVPVFPVHSAIRREGRWGCTCGDAMCLSPAKHPVATVAPNGLKNATTDPELIRSWWLERPWMNLAVATGRVVVLDVDPRHGGDDSLKALEGHHGALPTTWRTLTGGGGEHVWFAPPDGKTIRNSSGKLGAGLDIRAAGGYVVAPPSQHISGRPYAWSVDHHPADVPLAPMPDWLVAKLEERQTPEAIRGRREELLHLVCWGVDEGGRNNAVARLVGHLLRRDVDARIVLEIATIWNDTRCRPPLGEMEIIGICDSIARRELERRGGQQNAA